MIIAELSQAGMTPFIYAAFIVGAILAVKDVFEGKY